MNTLLLVLTMAFATSSFAANQSYECFAHVALLDEDDEYHDQNSYLLERLSEKRYSLKIYPQRDTETTLYKLRAGYWESEDGEYALSLDSRGRASLDTNGGYFRVECE